MGIKVVIRDRKELETRIIKIANEVEKIMALDWIFITHHFSTDTPDDQATACTTETEWQYRQARLIWNLDICAGASDRAIFEMVTHEMIHILMGPLKEHIKSGG